MPLERKITFIPAYDKTDPVPSKNYGIHGMVIGFQLRGPEGTLNWNFHTGIYLEHNRKNFSYSSVYGNEVCGHSSKPFDGSDGPGQICDLIGGVPCHSAVLTGAIFGQELGEKLISDGDAAIWAELEQTYHRLWPQLELKGLST